MIEPLSNPYKLIAFGDTTWEQIIFITAIVVGSIVLSYAYYRFRESEDWEPGPFARGRC